MQRIAKSKIIYIVIIIVIILIYFLFIKEKNDLNIDETYINQEISNKEKEEEEINNIVVYITGAVNNEGVYELKENSRIADLIEAAGGLTEEANIDNINLAFKIEDGIKIHIPKKGEEVLNTTETYISNQNDNLKEVESVSKNEKININTATQAQLETLPGIGPSTALKIINYRKENGKFKSIEDIKDVSGIGDSKFAKIKDFIKI